MNKKSIPGAVLGIIGAVFIIIGGLNIALCAEVVSATSGGAINYTWVAYVLGFGGGAVALVGAILDFKRPVIGGVFLIVATAMAVALCIIMYWAWAVIIGFVLTALAGILSFVVQKGA